MVMRTQRIVQAILVLTLAAARTPAAVVAPVPALPPSAAATAGLGAAIGARVLPSADAVSLRGAVPTLVSLDQFRLSSPVIADPGQKAAAAAVVAAPSVAPAAEAEKDPAVAADIEDGRLVKAVLRLWDSEHPERVLPENLVPTFQEFLRNDKADANAAPVSAEPVVAAASARTVPASGLAPSAPPTGPAPNAEKDWSQVDPKDLLDPAKRPKIAFGSASLPAVAQPTLGDDISGLWLSAHAQSRSALIAMYNFDDLAMAQAIVAAAKNGQKQVIVGDYSNWFPFRMPAAIAESEKNHTPLPEPTDAMKLIAANLGPNLELHILKGLTSIGINHNKFTVFTAPDGKELLQGGSFNYTATSQDSHWENVVYTNDADRLSFYKNYHAWILRRSRPYSPDLPLQDPTFDPNDPIPQDLSRALVFHGTAFPKASGSPNGGTEDWLVLAESLVRKSLDILMFSPFPTPKMAAAITDLLDKGIPVRLIADRGQVAFAGGVLWPLMEKGLKLKVIVGPDVVLNHKEYGEHSKMHEKVMIFDGGTPDALAKMGDSLNISNNALAHNFENTGFWQGFAAAFIHAHFNALWDLASDPTAELLAKLKEEYDRKSDAPGPAKE